MRKPHIAVIGHLAGTGSDKVSAARRFLLCSSIRSGMGQLMG
jgi:hypothetical protein